MVEDKIYEADFFLDKIKECTDLQECKYYLSAFLSASRSITFCLQACMSGIEGFDQWYQEKQEKLRQNDLAKKFVEMRNHTQKIGIYHLGSGESYRDANGNTGMKFYFSDERNSFSRIELVESILSGDYFVRKEKDVATQCEENFTFLIEIIFDCFSNSSVRYYV